MADFIRARSAEQKEQRLNEIKGAVRRQFAERPYHEITLTTIAEELGWSRANLYKYVSTKEEVFLLLAADECRAYFDALLAALPEGCGLSPATIAEVWAGIANAHQEYFRLGDLLSTIIETNVGVERLAEFKRCYYDCVGTMRERLPQIGHEFRHSLFGFGREIFSLRTAKHNAGFPLILLRVHDPECDADPRRAYEERIQYAD